MFISAVEDCEYTFTWPTAAACPVKTNVHGDCQVTNPVTGETHWPPAPPHEGPAGHCPPQGGTQYAAGAGHLGSSIRPFPWGLSVCCVVAVLGEETSRLPESRDPVTAVSTGAGHARSGLAEPAAVSLLAACQFTWATRTPPLRLLGTWKTQVAAHRPWVLCHGALPSPTGIRVAAVSQIQEVHPVSLCLWGERSHLRVLGTGGLVMWAGQSGAF